MLDIDQSLRGPHQLHCYASPALNQRHRKMKRSIYTKLLIACFSATLLASCAVNQSGQVGPDGDVFNKGKVIPLGAGILSAVICNKLFDGHGSRDGWTAVCGAAGYFGTVAFTNQYNQTMEENKTGQTASWSDPDGKSYSVTPTETYYVDEQPCRKFRQTVEINGQVEILSGTACRQADGTWKLTS